MSNFFSDTVAATPGNPEGVPSPDGGNFFADTTRGVTLTPQEQATVGKVNSVSLESPDSFGLVEIPKDIAKGFAAEMARLPADVGGLVVQTGENLEENLAFVEQAKKTAEGKGEDFGALDRASTAFAKNIIDRIDITEDGKVELPNIFEMGLAFFETEVDLIASMFTDSEGTKVITNAGYNMVKDNQQALVDMDLIPQGETSVAYDVGSGFSSVLKSVGLTMLTKNPSVAAGHMGLTVNSRDYIEAREAGKTPDEAASIAAQSAVSQGAIEAIGGKFFLGAARNSSFVKKVIMRTAGQGAEEGTQSAAELTIKTRNGVRDVMLEEAIQEIGYSAMIGVLAGAPVTTLATSLEKKGVEMGMPAKMAKELSENMVAGRDDLQDAAVALLDKEATGLSRETNTIDASKQAVKEVIAKKEEELNLEGARKEIKDSQITEIEAIDNQLDEISIDQLRDVQALEDQKTSIDVVAERLIQEHNNITTEIQEVEQRLSDSETQITNLSKQEGDNAVQLNTLNDEKISVQNSLDGLNTSLESINTELKEQNINPEDVPQISEKITANKQLDDKINTLKESGKQQVTELSARRADLQNVVAGRSLENIFDNEEIAKNTTRNKDLQQRLVNEANKKGEIAEKVGEIGKDIKRLTGAALTPISTRLKNISPKLRARLRRFEFNISRQIQEDEKVLVPFLDKYKKMDKNDRVILDYAMKNGDVDLINEMSSKYDMAQEVESVREMLNNIYKRADEAGMEISYRDNFFPRHVKDAEGLLNYFQKTEMWDDISKGIEQKELELGRILTTEEKAHLINTLLRGYKSAQITLAKPGALKERNVDRVSADIDKFYNTSDQALLRYISVVNDAIETRKFFGKGSTGLLQNIDDSVGYFVMKELQEGNINITDAKEVSDIMKARFNRGQMSTLWRVYKNFSYIDTMGSPISAITQLGDLAFAMYKSGVYRTLKAFAPATVKRSQVSREDIGIEKIAQEFQDTSKSANAVSTVFKAVGLDRIDAIGKETLINSSLERFQQAAKKDSKELRAELEVIFEEETDSVIQDLKDGKITENIKLLLFNQLLDLQPVALSEMPEAYLKSGNGRIFYMLKSFTIKQIDVYRNEVFAEIRKGNTVQGLKNLTRLMAFFVMMNASADFLKDLVLGREKEPEDYLVDNILRAFAISKFQIYTARREGVGTAAAKTILPPFKFIDSMYKDIDKAIRKKGTNPNDLKTIQSIPVTGKMYYWWFGAGADQNKKKKKTF